MGTTVRWTPAQRCPGRTSDELDRDMTVLEGLRRSCRQKNAYALGNGKLIQTKRGPPFDDGKSTIEHSQNGCLYCVRSDSRGQGPMDLKTRPDAMKSIEPGGCWGLLHTEGWPDLEAVVMGRRQWLWNPSYAVMLNMGSWDEGSQAHFKQTEWPRFMEQLGYEAHCLPMEAHACEPLDPRKPRLSRRTEANKKWRFADPQPQPRWVTRSSSFFAFPGSD
ncbi:hypothetical protein VTI74DRAFT_8780 [Chaetomium olivicolor]